MVTSKQCLAKYGDPYKELAMTVWDVPTELEIGVIPKKLYCNKEMVGPLTLAFKNLIDRGFVSELKTWDGCFNLRNKKGASTMSLHSWGIAVDLNAAWNRFRDHHPVLSPGFVKCFTDVGFEWGGTWPNNTDGMHFQLASI